MLVLGGDWRYWYNGTIYSCEIARGLTFSSSHQPSSSPRTKSTRRRPVKSFRVLNVQNQQKIGVARQVCSRASVSRSVTRSLALSAIRFADLQKAMKAAETSHMNKKQLASSRPWPIADKTAATTNSPVDAGAGACTRQKILKRPSPDRLKIAIGGALFRQTHSAF